MVARLVWTDHMTPPVEHPFSTALATKILNIIRDRDLELLNLRNQYQSNTLTREAFATALEASDTKTYDDVLEACQKTMATLETTVDRVLQLDAQLREIRAHEASRIVAPGVNL